MKKIFFITLIVFLSFADVSFACGCGCKNSPCGNSNCQKACQTIFSLIALDLSLLSPRATAADVHTCMPKNCCMHKTPCYMPQAPCCMPQPPCCTPQNPCCCPKQSMAPVDNTQATIVTAENSQNGIIPVANKQISNKFCVNSQDRKSFFRVDLFRLFKFQVW